MMTDPVGDLLTRIRNGQSARLESVTVPASRMRSNVLDVLQREGYIRGWFEEELRKGVKELRVELKYDNGKITSNVELYHDWGLTPSSFGEDAAGELYICAHEPGVIYRIVGK